jgi:putative ABC transport system permease protein
MLGVRWRKVFADLWSNKVRTLLVVLSIAVGVFAVGFVSTAFIILLGDMDADYQSINPHSAAIYVATPFDQSLIDALKSVKGIGELEGFSSLQGRITTADGKKVTILFTAVEDFSEMKIDRVRPNTKDGKGSLKPLDKYEIYLERSAMGALQAKPGDTITVEFEKGRTRQLKIADIVYNIASPPFIFTNMASAYVNPDTMEWLGGSRNFNTVYLTVAENKRDEAHVKAVAKEVENKIEKSGRRVVFTFVGRPGRHWATDITQALGYLMGFLGLLAVFLSTFLVINTIFSFAFAARPLLGMMKAVGGKTSQIAAMYFVMVLIFGIIAFILALPLSTVLGYSITQPIAGLLNFNVGSMRIPKEALILQIVVALFVLWRLRRCRL